VQAHALTRAGRGDARLVWLLVVATFLAYWPVYDAGFVWDDDYYVTENPVLRDLAGLARLWVPGTTVQYYPAVFTTFWVEYRLWGLDPLGYHVVNVALHALASLLVWRTGRVIGLPGAGFVAALFALHPVHVESVAWITERKNVLSAVFYLLAALAWWRHEDERHGASPGDGTSPGNGAVAAAPRRGYAIATALFVLALLSKTVTCSLPAVLVLVRLWRRRPLDRRFLLALAPWFAIGLALALHTAHVERVQVGATGDDFDLAFAERLEVAARALLFYPTKLLVPLDLAFVYPRWSLGQSGWAWPVALVAGVAVAACVGWWRGARGPALALVYFAGTLVPALGFFDVYPMRYSFVADHFQYLASLGVFVLVAGLGVRVVRGGRLRTAVAVLVLAPLAVATMRQARDYASLETLWRATIATNPAAWMAHGNLAELLGERGANEEALVHVDAGLAACTSAAGALDLRANRAVLLGRLGRTEEALAELETVHAARGGNELDVATALERLGRESEAESWYRRALAAPQPRPDAPARFARFLVQRGRAAEAVELLVPVVLARPDDLDSRLFLADAYAAAGRTDDALAALAQCRAAALARGDARLVELIDRRRAQLGAR
jgi:tetratricopeptide (TPR) repeat protein